MKRFCSALAFITTAAAHDVSSGLGEELIKGFNVQVSYNAWSEVAAFRVVIPDQTWFGIVLGSSSHANSDMV